MHQYAQPVVYPEYVELVDKVASEIGVHPDDWQKLRSLIPVQQRDYSGHGETTYEIQVGGEFPFHWRGKGKVFEVVGPNMRNKTNTLIYTATLLGLDWTAVEPYLDDKKIATQARHIQTLLSSGQANAQLRIQNDLYEMVVVIKDCLADMSVWRKADNKRIGLINEQRLAGETDWAEFRKQMKGLFDVEFVAKGRNFVAQVGFEEATSLARFCEETAHVVSDYTQMLFAQAPLKDPEQIRRQLSELDRRLKAQYAQRAELNKLIRSLEGEQQGLALQIDELGQLLADNDLRKAFELASRVYEAEEIENKANDLRAQKHAAEQDRKNLVETVEFNGQALAKLDAAMQRLDEEFANIRNNLDLTYEPLRRLDEAIRGKDVSGLLEVLPLLRVDSATVNAHEALAAFTPPGISLDTRLLGVSVLGNEAGTLSGFRTGVAKATQSAKALESLNASMTRVDAALTALSITSAEEYQSTVANLPVLQTMVETLDNRLKELTGLISDCSRDLARVLSSYGSLDALKTALGQIRGTVDGTAMGRVEEIMYGHVDAYTDEIQDLLLQKHEDLATQLNDLRDKRKSAERMIDKLRFEHSNKETELAQCADTEHVLERTKLLIDLRDFLEDVNEYFTNKRLAFELRGAGQQSEGYLKEAKTNESNLGTRFEDVISLINERIRRRCPFAFVNLDGVKLKAVKRFDFLTEDYEVENLPEGAKRHGGIVSSMTVYGLATKMTGTVFGSVLLVDEWGDVGVYTDHVFKALVGVPQLAFSIFVDVDQNATDVVFQERRF